MNIRAVAVVAWIGVPVSAVAGPDLESLPSYIPKQSVSGVIRNFGSPLAGVLKLWEDEFVRYQPNIRFEDQLQSSDAAIGGLMAGVADLAPMGREGSLNEFLGFYEMFKHDLVSMTVATGAHDIAGRTYCLVVYAHKDNPLTKLSLQEVDGIFGAERTGGYRGYKWMPQAARGPEANIRTWGQLGLTGEWADHTINTYGYADTGMRSFFELTVFGGGSKWNPNYREYVETGTKMVADESLTIHRMLAELSQDRYGIGWTGLPQARDFPQVRPLALAARKGGAYLPPTRENVQNRTYPLTRSIFIHIKRGPGKPYEPKLKEFLTFILSRQGQEVVARHNVYLPLTAEVVHEERKKLE
jgi:phosphate transport system substrate-binding protein